MFDRVHTGGDEAASGSFGLLRVQIHGVLRRRLARKVPATGNVPKAQKKERAQRADRWPGRFEYRDLVMLGRRSSDSALLRCSGIRRLLVAIEHLRAVAHRLDSRVGTHICFVFAKTHLR